MARKVRPLGTVLILLTLMLVTVVVPLVGMAVDGLMLYGVKARLAAAVEGGASAAARALSADADECEQRDAARRVAEQFVRANFPTGYWRSRDLELDPQVLIASDAGAGRRVVEVGAHVRVRLMFLRLLGREHSTVSARASAARRLVRVVLALDSNAAGKPWTFPGQLGAMADRLAGPRGELPPVVWGNGIADMLAAAHSELARNSMPGALNAIVLLAAHPAQDGGAPARLVSWNSVWETARRIRRQAPQTAIFIVGCEMPEPPENAVLMKMVANAKDPDNPAYDPSAPAGLFLPAASEPETAAALATAASEIFRLSF